MKMVHPTFEFNTKYVQCKEARLVFGAYIDGSTAIQIVGDCGEGFEEPISTATVCLEEYGMTPEPGRVFIKDWSENEGTLLALQKAGIVGPTLNKVGAGFATAYEVELKVGP